MADRPKSLTGHWTGVYDYPNAFAEPVPFNAEIDESAATFVGESEEPNTFADPMVDTLLATLAGHREGDAVSFVKTYAPVSGAGHKVRYEGVANADLTKIEGRWRVDGAITWSGPFVMNRADATATEAMEAREEVEAPLEVAPDR
ncbi:MAG: hypothetical protein AAFQ73_13630 [Pseudomonadota bacterium]